MCLSILISLTEAKKNGLKRYFTGKPCKRGHISERHVINGTCIQCVLESEVHKNNCKHWNKTNRDKRRKYRKDFYYNNIDKEREYSKNYRNKNKEYFLDKSRKHYYANKEQYAIRKKQHCKKNPELYRAYANNRRAKISKNGGKHSKEDIAEIYEKQKGNCAYCRKELKGIYNVDHIIPISKGGTNYKKNLQITCPLCNNKKKDKLPEIFARELGLLI